MNRIDLAEELTEELQQGAFSSAHCLSAWLSNKGYAIGPTPIQGSLFPAENVLSLSAYRLKRCENPSTNGDVTDQILALMQEKLLLELEKPHHLSLVGVNVVTLGRMVAEITKASIAQKRYNTEIMDRANKAADEVQRVGKSVGLSQEVVDAIRTQVLGIIDVA